MVCPRFHSSWMTLGRSRQKKNLKKTFLWHQLQNWKKWLSRKNWKMQFWFFCCCRCCCSCFCCRCCCCCCCYCCWCRSQNGVDCIWSLFQSKQNFWVEEIFESLLYYDGAKITWIIFKMREMGLPSKAAFISGMTKFCVASNWDPIQQNSSSFNWL